MTHTAAGEPYEKTLVKERPYAVPKWSSCCIRRGTLASTQPPTGKGRIVFTAPSFVSLRALSLAVTAFALVAFACSDENDSPGGAAGSPDVDIDFQPYTTIEDLAGASDIVVRGSITEIDRAIEWGDIKPDDIEVSRFRVQVSEYLVGAGSEEIEVALETGSNGKPYPIGTEFAGRPTPGVGDEGIWFLTRVDPMFDFPGYRLTNVQGLVIEESGSVVGGGPAELPLRAEFADLRSLDAIAARLKGS